MSVRQHNRGRTKFSAKNRSGQPDLLEEGVVLAPAGLSAPLHPHHLELPLPLAELRPPAGRRQTGKLFNGLFVLKC